LVAVLQPGNTDKILHEIGSYSWSDTSINRVTLRDRLSVSIGCLLSNFFAVNTAPFCLPLTLYAAGVKNKRRRSAIQQIHVFSVASWHFTLFFNH
jgi:hypothetical protein